MLLRRIPFFHPCGNPPAPRTAILLPGFRSRGSVKSVVAGHDSVKWLHKLEEFQPESLAGSLGQLLLLASLSRSHVIQLDHLRHSLIVIFRTEQPWISEEEREELWSAFGLPIYTQIYSVTGGLLATECEAHDGLHVTPGALWSVDAGGELWFQEPPAWWEERGDSFAPSGLFGSVDQAICDCGRKTSRLQVAGPMQRDLLYARQAVA